MEIMVLILIGIIVVCLLASGEVFWPILIIVVGVCIFYYKNKKNTYINKKNTEKDDKKTSVPYSRPYVPYSRPYLNHCWNCQREIDSNYNRKCPKCNKYYICNYCGKCLCDSPQYNK